MSTEFELSELVDDKDGNSTNPAMTKSFKLISYYNPMIQITSPEELTSQLDLTSSVKLSFFKNSWEVREFAGLTELIAILLLAVIFSEIVNG